MEKLLKTIKADDIISARAAAKRIFPPEYKCLRLELKNKLSPGRKIYNVYGKLKARYTKTCKYCRMPMHTEKFTINQKYFCSYECKKKWQSIHCKSINNRTKEKRTCTHCNKKYYGIINDLNSLNHFCSRKCQGEWQSIHSRGINSSSWVGGKTKEKRICTYCKKEYCGIINNIPTQNHFCSRECQGKWTSKNKTGPNSYAWKGGKKYHPQKKTQKKKDEIKMIRNINNLLKQNNICPYCKKNIANSVHHIIPRKYNGSNDDTNLINLCFGCHDIIEIKTEDWIISKKYYNINIFRAMITNRGFY